MAKGRTTSAENIKDILDTALRRRQRGFLSIESQQGNILEEGEIYVENGQITYAHTNQLRGQAALKVILNWRGVYFAFATNEYPARSSAAEQDVTTLVTTKAQTREMPLGLPAPSGQNSSHVPTTSPGLPQFSAGRSAQPAARNDANTDPLAEVRRPDTAMPGVEWIIPRRINKEQNVLSLPLTRPQRSIYMLIDSHRSISDLARCTRKTIQEIERLLSELQERGLITI
ncbi:MAG: DUF4388 domain-containing protein [Ktedonobacteraceae bacterium]